MSPIDNEDAWGSDTEDPHPPVISNRKPHRIPPRNTPQAQQTPPSVLSLESLCLTTLATHLLTYLLDTHDEILPFLLTDHKATLLSAARIRGLLNDHTLSLLYDETQSILNLHNTATATISGLINILEKQHSLVGINNLQYLDIRGMHITGSSLLSIAKYCPRITVLKFGDVNNNNAINVDAIGKHLMSILPVLQPKEPNLIADSWEHDGDNDNGDNISGDMNNKRLMDLSCVCWPEIPYSVLKKCKEMSPAVWINPTDDNIALYRLPIVYSMTIEVDESVVIENIVGGRQALVEYAMKSNENNDSNNISSMDAESSISRVKHKDDDAVVHIADKFKMAYISRAQRLKAKELMERRKMMNKELVGAAAAIRQWEMEV